MRQIHPVVADDFDVAAAYLSDRREPTGSRPWLVVNMATTIDGATALTGRSGGIGGPGDHAAFHALRSAADVILVGAGTARAENYGPVRVRPDHVDARRTAGRDGPARLAVVSRSCAIDPHARFFGGDGPRPLVYTVDSAPHDRVAALEPVAQIVRVGTSDVDVRRVLDDLGKRGARCVLCEGGPTLNGQLVAADVIDEWCVTTGSLLASGPSARAAHSPDGTTPHEFRLERLVFDGRDLLARYVHERHVAGRGASADVSRDDS